MPTRESYQPSRPVAMGVAKPPRWIGGGGRDRSGTVNAGEDHTKKLGERRTCPDAPQALRVLTPAVHQLDEVVSALVSVLVSLFVSDFVSGFDSAVVPVAVLLPSSEPPLPLRA